MLTPDMSDTVEVRTKIIRSAGNRVKEIFLIL